MAAQNRIQVRGSTVEKKFLHIENILNRMQRKLHKTVIGVLPPIPLFFYAEKAQESGEIFQWLFPAQGVITRACMYVREYKTKDGITFTADMIGKTSSTSQSFMTRKNALIQTLNIPVSIGDRLIFRVDSPEQITGIWVAFLFEMNMKDLAKETFIIDEFTKLMNQEIGEITDAAIAAEEVS